MGDEAGWLKSLYTQLSKTAQYPGTTVQSSQNLEIWFQEIETTDTLMRLYSSTELLDLSVEMKQRWEELFNEPYRDFIIKGYDLLFEYLSVVGRSYAENGLLLEAPEGEAIVKDLFVKAIEYPSFKLIRELDLFYWQNFLDAIHALIVGYAMDDKARGRRSGKNYLREHDQLVRKLHEDGWLAPSPEYITETREDLMNYLAIIAKYIQERDPNNGIIPLHVTKSDSDVSAHRRKEEHNGKTGENKEEGTESDNDTVEDSDGE